MNSKIEYRLALVKFKSVVKATAEDTRASRKIQRGLIKRARKLEAAGDAPGAKALRNDHFQVTIKVDEGRTLRRLQHLAYCYLKGRTYRQCESKGDVPRGGYAPAVERIVEYLRANDPYRYQFRVLPLHLHTFVTAWLDMGDKTRFEIEADLIVEAEPAKVKTELSRQEALFKAALERRQKMQEAMYKASNDLESAKSWHKHAEMHLERVNKNLNILKEKAQEVAA